MSEYGPAVEEASRKGCDGLLHSGVVNPHLAGYPARDLLELSVNADGTQGYLGTGQRAVVL